VELHPSDFIEKAEQAENWLEADWPSWQKRLEERGVTGLNLGESAEGRYLFTGPMFESTWIDEKEQLPILGALSRLVLHLDEDQKNRG
jgi:hypothetical protein